MFAQLLSLTASHQVLSLAAFRQLLSSTPFPFDIPFDMSHATSPLLWPPFDFHVEWKYMSRFLPHSITEVDLPFAWSLQSWKSHATCTSHPTRPTHLSGSFLPPRTTNRKQNRQRPTNVFGLRSQLIALDLIRSQVGSSHKHHEVVVVHCQYLL